MADSRRIRLLMLSNRSSAVEPERSATDGSVPNLLLTGLQARGVSVSVEPLGRFPLNPLAGFGTFYAGFDMLRALRVLSLRRDVDVVVSVGESNVAAILALAPLLRFRPKIVLREISQRGWSVRDRVVDFVLPRVDGIMALTPHQIAWASAEFRLKAIPHLVGFAIDENYFKRSSGAEGDDGTVLSVGDDPGRDYATLLAASGETTYTLVLRTGSAPAIPQQQRERVRLVGRLSCPELRALYERAAVVVVPLQHVDHPSGITSLLEAMAMGCAVVATDTGSTKHIVRDGVNGRLVPVGESAAMRAAIAALMADPEARARLGRAARRTVEDEHSYSAYIDRFVACLHDVVAGRASPGQRAGGPAVG